MFSFQNDFSCDMCAYTLLFFFFFKYGNMALSKLFEGGYYFFCRLLRKKEVSVTPTPSPLSPSVSKSLCPAQELEYLPNQAGRGGQTKLLHPRLQYIYPPLPISHPYSHWVCPVLQYPDTLSYCQFCSPSTPPHPPTAPHSQFY